MVESSTGENVMELLVRLLNHADETTDGVPHHDNY
jgi:hypothetical protein